MEMPAKQVKASSSALARTEARGRVPGQVPAGWLPQWQSGCQSSRAPDHQGQKEQDSHLPGRRLMVWESRPVNGVGEQRVGERAQMER